MRVVFIFTIFLLGFTCNNTTINKLEILKQILETQYSVEYKVSRRLLKKASQTEREIFSGVLFRDKKFIYTNSLIGEGVFDDSLCLYLDKINKMISLTGKNMSGIILMLPFYDPAEIIMYAHKKSNTSKIYNIGGDKAQTYYFTADSIPVKKVSFIERQVNNSFIIELTYQNFQDTICDIIDYKIIAGGVIKPKIRKIEDFIETKEGKRHLKAQYGEYTFFNNTLLEAIFDK